MSEQDDLRVRPSFNGRTNETEYQKKKIIRETINKLAIKVIARIADVQGHNSPIHRILSQESTETDIDFDYDVDFKRD
ncbi:hypothetical protein [Candidatus Endowatersipora endosymbiont of Watersipora subatra]|uniref:hypothetical protein n=1 Tax=Candidatus Endowatersipora endosymbiont of Watersipora subatra TaxID=3077946 RepID=UPI00312CAB33